MTKFNGPQKSSDLRTEAIVLKRTNFGETDRVLVLMTPVGKKTALARGVRREKSKLAGGIEVLSLTDVVLHAGKSDMMILTSARSKVFYKNILGDLARLEMAGEMMKRIMKVTEEDIESKEYFDVLKQSLSALNAGANIEIVSTWFYLNLARIGGEQINLLFDADGAPLKEDVRYAWDSYEKALRTAPAGKITTNEIKMLRVMLSAGLSVVLRVKNTAEMMPELAYIAKSLNQL